MPGLLNKCTSCGRYTLRQDNCPTCGAPVKSAHPTGISLKHRYIDLVVKLRKHRESG
ncbi:MAG: ribosome biogenesis protein [Aigarchaeota archaeon]|nr:ribosome biogenesis protein [Aigarchaeota archaeon]MDW8021662.1 nucleolar RNA-binding Nop10p family protein [Nitrososphaerota archaeon]